MSEPGDKVPFIDGDTEQVTIVKRNNDGTVMVSSPLFADGVLVRAEAICVYRFIESITETPSLGPLPQQETEPTSA